MIGLALVAAIAAGVGFATGRWAVLVPVAAAIPIYFLGLKADWWGYGVGDGWEYGLVLGALVAAAAAATGVIVRRAIRRRSDARLA